MTLKIVQRKNHNAVYASGFYSIERAQLWLANYNPQMWMEKNLTRDDLQIVEDRCTA